LIFTGIGIALGLSFFLLYKRKKEWNTDHLRWTITGLPFIVGLIGIFLINLKADKELKVLLLGMMVPLVYNSFDRLFKKLSEKYQGRDFYLYLRNSDEITERPLSNPHVKGMDIAFSFGLLIIIILLTLGAGLLFKEERGH